MIVSIKAKEGLVKRLAFPKLPLNPIEPPVIPCKLAHTKITKETLAPALIQVVTKALSLNKINFQIL